MITLPGQSTDLLCRREGRFQAILPVFRGIGKRRSHVHAEMDLAGGDMSKMIAPQSDESGLGVPLVEQVPFIERIITDFAANGSVVDVVGPAGFVNGVYTPPAGENGNVTIIWDHVLDEVLGDDSGVTGMRIRNVKTDEQTILDTDGVFVYVGLIPATKLIAGQVELDPAGYIVTDGHQHGNHIDAVDALAELRPGADPRRPRGSAGCACRSRRRSRSAPPGRQPQWSARRCRPRNRPRA